MVTPETLSASAELKFLDNEPAGTFGGLASVYGNRDSHDDVVAPGAFSESLAERKAQGRGLPKMYDNHSAFIGGSKHPIGKWDSMVEEPNGLRVKGHLIGMDHPDVKRIYDLMMEGEAGGLSIAFAPRPGGVVVGRRAGEPKRLLKSLDLFAVDVVFEASNPLAQIDHIKSLSLLCDPQAATGALVKAMVLHQQVTSGGNSPNGAQRAELMSLMQAAHHALTGQMMPPGMKQAPETIREFEEWLRDPVVGLGMSHSRARAIAEGGFKASLPRDGEGGSAVVPATKALLKDISASIDGFSLPKF